jgi:hypothetical protein
VRLRSTSLAAILVALATQLAMLAPLAPAAAGERCEMSCCAAAGEGASCPMHAASHGSSFRSCSSDPDGVAPTAGIVLALPTRVNPFLDDHPSGALSDAPPAPERLRAEKPPLPPPEGLA